MEKWSQMYVYMNKLPFLIFITFIFYPNLFGVKKKKTLKRLNWRMGRGHVVTCGSLLTGRRHRLQQRDKGNLSAPLPILQYYISSTNADFCIFFVCFVGKLWSSSKGHCGYHRYYNQGLSQQCTLGAL